MLTLWALARNLSWFGINLMYNKVVMVGHLTRDVELRYLNTGVAVASFGLASSRRYKKQDGTVAEDTCFIDINMFGRVAEVANQYLRKGSKVLIDGRLQFDAWVDQQGNKRSKHSVMAENMTMLDSKQSQGDSSHDGGNYANASNVQNPSFGNAYANSNQYAHADNMNTARYNNAGSENYQHADRFAGRSDPNSAGNNQSRGNNRPQIPEIDIDGEVPF